MSEGGGAGDETLHRFNQQLPDVYRSHMLREARLMHAALHRLARAITDSEPDSGDVQPGGDDPAGAEGYEWRLERDLSALDKGLCRYLDLKYLLKPGDYDVFVRVMLRALLTPGIDLGIRAKMVRAIGRVLRKRDCVLSFPIPWRQVKKVITEIHLDSADGGLYIGRDIRDVHCREMLSLLRKCRDHLGDNDDAQSIWSEFASQIDPSRADTSFESLLFLYHILPTGGSQWIGWLKPAAEIWSRLETSSDFDSVWLGLFSRLAKHQPNIIDWTPHLTMMYERLPTFFKLPLGAAAPQSPIERRCQAHCIFLLTSKHVTHSTAVFAIYALSPQLDGPLRFLKKTLAILSNFFHPSNNGRWSTYLSAFVGHLTSALVERVAEERAATRAGIHHRVLSCHSVKGIPPLEDRLPDEYVDNLVTIILPLLQSGLHSKLGYVTIQSATSARDLATVAPHLVVKPFLDAAAESLVSAMTPHRTSAALKTLATLTPVFLDEDLFPGGGDVLPQVLELTLPGIDANDPSKTEATFRFIAGASACLQSYRYRASNPDIDEFLDAYAHSLLDRIIGLLETLEVPAKKTKNGPTPPATLSPFLFCVAMENFFAACPSSVAISAAQRVARHVSGSACVSALKFYGALVRTTAAAAAAASPSGTSAPIFIPLLLNQIVEENDQGTKVLSGLSEEELTWRLRMLAQACRTCNNIVQYGDRLIDAVILAGRHPARKIYKGGGRLLRGMLEGLTSIRMRFGVRYSADHDGMDDDSRFEWRVPSQQEYEAGAKYLTKAIEIAEELCFSPEANDAPEGKHWTKEMVHVDRERLFRAVRLLHAAQRGGRWILAGAPHEKFNNIHRFDIEKGGSEQLDKESAKLVLKVPVLSGLRGEQVSGDPEQAKNLWHRIYTIVNCILGASIDKRPDDGALLSRCLEPIEMAHEQFRKVTGGRMSSRAEHGYKLAYKSVAMMKQEYEADGGVGRRMPRFIRKLRLQALHESRMSTSARASHCHQILFDRIMHQLEELSLNDFPLVRTRARTILTRSIRVATPNTRRSVITNIIEGMLEGVVVDPSKGTPNYEAMMGAATVLRSSGVAPLITRNWSLLKLCTVANVKAVVAAERPDSAVIVGTLFGRLASSIRPLSLGSMDLAPLGEDNQSNDGPLDETKISLYNELTQFVLATVIGDFSGGDIQMCTEIDQGLSKTHWRIQGLAATLLYMFMREDVRVTDRMVTFFVLSMASEIVAVRQVSIRAVGLILSLASRGKLTESAKVIAVIRGLVGDQDFCKKLVHTLALDQLDDTDGAGNGDGAGLSSNFSVTSLARNVDGEACWALIMGRPWPSSWVPRSRDSLSIVRVRLFELLSNAVGLDLLSAVGPTLDELLRDDGAVRGVTRENSRITVAEVVCGLGRGLPSDEKGVVAEALYSWSSTLLEAFSGQDGMVNGGSLIRFLNSGEYTSSGRETMARTLRMYLKAPLLDQTHSGGLQTRRLRYIHSFLADMEPSNEVAAEACSLLVPQLVTEEAMSHPLKYVREEVARLLSLLSTFNLPQAIEAYHKGVHDVSTRLKVEVQAPSEKKDDENTANKRRSREGECLSRWLAVVSWNGDTKAFAPHVATLLPAIFASLDDPDPERVSHARLALSLAAQARLDGDVLEKVLTASTEASKSLKWKIRGATLAFLQVVAFCHVFTELPGASHRIREVVLRLLKDEQLEVREAAEYTLVPLIRDAEVSEVEAVRELFLGSLARTRMATRGGTSGKERTAETIERHGAVLGLSSMVRSAPYSIPRWMPRVLVALTSCIGETAPISTSTGKIFTEFWRTHRDEWAEHKLAFQPDDLDAVSELLTAPSYYA